jgi:hypothetical protein
MNDSATTQQLQTTTAPNISVASAVSIDDCLALNASAAAVAQMFAGWKKEVDATEQVIRTEMDNAMVRSHGAQYDWFAHTVYALHWRMTADDKTSDDQKKQLKTGLEKFLSDQKITSKADTSLMHKIVKAVIGSTKAPSDRQRVSVYAIGLNEAARENIAPESLRGFMLERGWEKLRKQAAARAKEGRGESTWPTELTALREVLSKRSEAVIDVPLSTVQFGDAHEGEQALLIVTCKNGKLVINGVVQHDKQVVEQAKVAWARKHKDHDFTVQRPAACDPVTDGEYAGVEGE